MGDFNYNAPQYIDFTSPTELELQDFGEEYFEMDHEVEVEYNEVNENNEVFSEARQSSNPDLSSYQDDSVIVIEDSDDSQAKLRRSVSAGHIILTKNETPKKTPETHDAEEIMENALIKALDTLNFKSAKKPAPKIRRANGLSILPSKPMVVQSEQPKRLRKPQSISRVQMEAAEMKKHQIKAHPVNYKILRAPVLPAKSEITATKPEPFKFTEVKYHSLPKEPPKEVYEFHARPAPKTTAPGAIPVSRRSVMPKIDVTKKPPTPSFRRKYQADTLPAFCDNGNNKQTIKTVDMQHDGIQKKLFNEKPTKTQIKPFSFEERDRKIQEKKEEKIRKFLEEEKKAREFHARPIPSKVIGQCKKVESKVVKLISEGSSGSLKENKTMIDENAEPVHFKARPATVIHKKPFIPKKEERPLLEIQEFNLNTNQRAREREEFDKKMKEKEEEIEYHKKEREEYLRKIQDEEVKRLRKEIVHKANPIKAYKPIEIVPSMKKCTSPKSPFKSHKKFNETH